MVSLHRGSRTLLNLQSQRNVSKGCASKGTACWSVRSSELRLVLGCTGRIRSFDLKRCFGPDAVRSTMCSKHECLWRWWLVKGKWDLVPLRASSPELLPKFHYRVLHWFSETTDTAVSWCAGNAPISDPACSHEQTANHALGAQQACSAAVFVGVRCAAGTAVCSDSSACSAVSIGEAPASCH